MIIKVTRAHIDMGDDGHCRTCPVALAINEVLSTDYFSVIRPGTIYLNHMKMIGEGISREMPEHVARFVKWFDAHGVVEPIEFELDIPVRMLKPLNANLE